MTLLACDSAPRPTPTPDQLDAETPRDDDASLTDAEPLGGYPEEPPLYRNGTRLKALRLVSDSGEPLFVGWFDTKIGERCTFQETSDGVERCVPGTENAHELAHYFEDDACIAPLDLRPFEDCYPDSAYVVWQGEVYEAEKVPTDTPVYVKGEQGCKPWTWIDKPGSSPPQRLFRMKRALPLGSLVASEVRTLPGGRLRRRVRETDDGALASLGIWDEERGAACEIYELGDGAACFLEGEVVADGQGAPARLQRVGTDRLQLQVQRSVEGYLLGPGPFTLYEKDGRGQRAGAYYDRELAAPCSPTDDRPGSYCAPTNQMDVISLAGISQAGFYRFADCTQLVSAIPLSQMPPKTFAVIFQTPAICDRVGIRVKGASDAPAYMKTDAGCAPAVSDELVRLYEDLPRSASVRFELTQE